MTNEEKLKSLSTKELAHLMDSVLSDCQVCPICDFCEDTRSKLNRFLHCKTVCERWLKTEERVND